MFSRELARMECLGAGLLVVVHRLFEIVMGVVELLHFRRAFVLPLARRDALLVIAQRARHLAKSGLEGIAGSRAIAGAGRRWRDQRQRDF